MGSLQAKSYIYAAIKIKRFAVPNYDDIYLTKCKIKCLMHLFKDHVTKESSVILNISVKSVGS